MSASLIWRTVYPYSFLHKHSGAPCDQAWAHSESTRHGVQGLLQGARCRARGQRRRHQEGLSPPRTQAPPGHQQGAGIRSAHAGTQRSVRGAARQGEACRLRQRGPACARRPAVPAAPRLGQRLRVQRRVRRVRRWGGPQRLLRGPVRRRTARRGSRPARLRAGRRAARAGPSRQDRGAAGRRLSRRHARDHPAQPGDGRCRQRGAARAHAAGVDPEGHPRRPADPPDGPGFVGLRRRCARRPVPGGRVRAPSAMARRRARCLRDAARGALGGRAGRRRGSTDTGRRRRDEHPRRLADRTQAAPARPRHSRHPPGDFYVLLELVLPAANDEKARAAYRQISRDLAFDPRAPQGADA